MRSGVFLGVGENPAALVGESADLLYHLLVLWAAVGVSPADVAAELARREGTSGIAEKRARSNLCLHGRAFRLRQTNDEGGPLAGGGFNFQLAPMPLDDARDILHQVTSDDPPAAFLYQGSLFLVLLLGSSSDIEVCRT